MTKIKKANKQDVFEQMINSQTFLGSMVDTVKKPFVFAGDFLENGAHAQQSVPSQHRWKSAAGMFAGWWGMDKLRDYIFGYTQKSEGEFVEVPLEDVPLPLHWLHKTIEWDPHSDSPENLHKKVLYQSLPLIGAAAGTLLGSIVAVNKFGEKFTKATNAKSLNILEADTAFQYQMSKFWSGITAIFGGESAASGLTPAYGGGLNSRFLDATGKRNTLVDIIRGWGLRLGNTNPETTIKNLLDNSPAYIKAFENGDKTAMDAWAGKILDQVGVIFNKNFKDPKVQVEARNKIKELMESSYIAHKNNPEALQKIQKDMKQVFDGAKFDEFIVQKLGVNLGDAEFGGANPLSRSINRLYNNFLETFGVKTKNEDYWRGKVAVKHNELGLAGV